MISLGDRADKFGDIFVVSPASLYEDRSESGECQFRAEVPFVKYSCPRFLTRRECQSQIMHNIPYFRILDVADQGMKYSSVFILGQATGRPESGWGKGEIVK
ncbi:hypothetical protein VKT23_010877 [Stygiomarasmius scandens]|uniref:Uncharacterized protein n=1 Tax=Marasmiellus scandens TaxID=2682957 RepID=A0ABR1JB36_9AGAR